MPDRQSELKAAKARLSGAAIACLENRPGAAEAADQARIEVDALLQQSCTSRQLPAIPR
ncbi:MAG: hypothetical protein HY322_18605 [Betaproteobacteria bacterium]|nr:hypothetical protein [Betaproteobacteria bacterium]